MPIEIRLPALAPDFEGGTIESWHKAVGDVIVAGDVIADIETDKAVVEIEATESGILGKIVVAAGTSDVPVNAVIGLLLHPGPSLQRRGRGEGTSLFAFRKCRGSRFSKTYLGQVWVGNLFLVCSIVKSNGPSDKIACYGWFTENR